MADAREEFSRLIRPVLSTLEIDLSPTQISQLAAHFELLEQWNRRINLTSVREGAEIVERHFGESLFTGLRIPGSALSLVDVGSGGGFPGLPIAVLRSTLEVTLVESVAKKAAFLREASRDRDNVRVHHGRFDTLQESFEWATVRAVACEEIWEDLTRRARRVAILSTAKRLPDLRALGGVRWYAEELLPWGRDRVLLLGVASG
jgi:16S rRNA (guanine527-N7)-methyltransferase